MDVSLRFRHLLLEAAETGQGLIITIEDAQAILILVARVLSYAKWSVLTEERFSKALIKICREETKHKYFKFEGGKC